MRKMFVWVVEILKQHDGKWYVWQPHNDKYGAFASKKFAMKCYPEEKFRVRKYVPETGEKHE